MTESEEKSWREYYAKEARNHWLEFPWELIGVLWAIIICNDYTSAQKVDHIQWAMEAYNNAMEETRANLTDSGRHRTSCPEHTED